jgi:acyl-CoA thioester hydrolase
MEEALTVRTTVLELAGARMRLDQAVLRGGDVLVQSDVEVCIITMAGRPRRIPDSTRKKLEFFLKSP